MTLHLTRWGAALVLALTATLATACAASPQAEPQPTGSHSATPGSTPQPSTQPTTAPTASADPACETIVPESVVSDFQSIGWSARTDPFYIGDTQLQGGLQCVWANFEGPAGDHLQVFGWAPITADQAKKAEDDLVAQGWTRETSVDGVYITEDRSTAIAVDDQGYGMTYLFGDGWVKLADTKEGLLLISWPPAS
jgi:hypothetical protein